MYKLDEKKEDGLLENLREISQSRELPWLRK